MDWGQLLLASGIASAPALVVVAWIKSRAPMKLAEVQAEGPLWARICALEERLESERVECDQRIGRMEERHEADVTELKRQVSALRHDRNNLRQGLTALFAMIRQIDQPELHRIVETVEDLIAKGDQAIAIERAAIPAARNRRAK